MKYVYFSLVFVFGFVAGRWSSSDMNEISGNIAQTESHREDIQSKPSVVTIEEGLQPLDEKLAHESKLTENLNLLRTDDKARDRQIRQLFSELMQASEKGQTEEQNRIFREMESLNPRHETVFQARAMFLQDDEDWQGAHGVLKECVSVIPNSIYCLRRLANIRSSTVDEKLQYGNECLQASKNDPLCLVDVAMALHSKGEFAKAKSYFEQALSLPARSEGYDKNYLLYQYAQTLERLGLYSQAKSALTESCRLNMKSACEEIQREGK